MTAGAANRPSIRAIELSGQPKTIRPKSWQPIIERMIHDRMGKILKYQKKYERELLSLLKDEPDWASFVAGEAIETFKESLLESYTLLYQNQGKICGYLRALTDGFGLYVSELYVAPNSRGNCFGALLLHEMKQEHPNSNVYVFSDEDLYYEKLGYKRVGSVFQI